MTNAVDILGNALMHAREVILAARWHYDADVAAIDDALADAEAAMPEPIGYVRPSDVALLGTPGVVRIETQIYLDPMGDPNTKPRCQFTLDRSLNRA